MSKKQEPTNESLTGVVLPDDGQVNTSWAKEQLARVDLFSQELLNYGKGEIFFMLQNSLGAQGFEQSIKDLGYTVETAVVYISYLQKKSVLEAIKDKFYSALSLSAAAVIPDSTEDALALCDVCVAKYGKLTAENLAKAAEDTGMGHKKMSNSAVGIEAMKKKALNDWLKDTFDMTDDQILESGRLKPEGKAEFVEKMANAYDRLGSFDNAFYGIIADAVMYSENQNAIRFLADISDASKSMEEFLEAESAYRLLQDRKEQFEQEVYPEIQFNASK